MGDVAMTSSAHSPNTVLERYTISRSNASISFEVGNNVVLHMGSDDGDEAGRDRDSSNIHTKVIMDHRGDIRNLDGRILTASEGLVGFRTIHESVGESINVINIQTKQRHRFKEIGDRRAVDIGFAHHNKFFAVIDAESSLFVYKMTEACEATKYVSVLNWPSKSTRDTSERPRLAWCPYIPGDDDEDESGDDEDCHVLAIYAGRHMHVLNLGILRDDGKGDEFDFEEAKAVEGAVYSMTIDEDSENEDVHIASVCIAPDATAVAVAKSNGPVSFYVINDEDNSFKYAHTFDPRCAGRNGDITDLIFLDDLTPDRKDVQFWRSCIAVSNGGRQLALFECQSWKRLGRVRFECPLAVNDFTPILDPTAGFLHLLDIDGSIVYSIEITNPVEPDGYPHFAGVTQTSFCHPIYAIAPITKNTFESVDESSDDIFHDVDEEDEEESDEGGDYGKVGDIRKVKTKRYFVAMGKKSMLELQITLKQHITPGTNTAESAESGDSEGDSRRAPTIIESLGGQSTTNTRDLHVEVPQRSEFNEMIIEQLTEMNARMQRMETDQKEKNDKMLDLIGKLASGSDDQVRLRESYLLNRIEQVCENSRLDILSTIRSGFSSTLAEIEPAVRNSNAETSEYVSQRVGSSVRAGLQEVVAPAFERTCDLLFERLNDHFRAGLTEYLASTSQAIQNAALAAIQLAVQQQPQLVPMAQQVELDRMSIMQLLNTSPELAFEMALNKADAQLVEFVISKVNPDSLFQPQSILSQPVLLSLLQQLTLNLSHEQDLKYRYIEQILPAVNVSEPEIAQVLPKVGQQLLLKLQEIMNHTTDPQSRRMTRLLFQLTRSTFYQSPHPQRAMHPELHGVSHQSPM